MNKKSIIPPFYTIPKIHKIGHPGRPLVSGINTATEKISLYVDEILKPYVKKSQSYIKDTNHFLQILNEVNTTEEDILCSLDVTSLYTNISHMDGLRSI